MRGHFLRKNFFLVFCLGQLWGLPNNIRHSSRKKTKRSCEVWPSGGDKVEFVEAEGRRKVEGLRKISRRRKEKYFLGCSVVWNSVPGLYWSLFSLLRRFWALFLEFFGLRWALHSRNFVRRPLVPRFYKVSTLALPGDTSSSSVSVLGTTIGNHIIAPRFVGSCRCLWTSWTMGIFFGSAKAEFRIWKFSTTRCTNHVRDDKYQ